MPAPRRAGGAGTASGSAAVGPSAGGSGVASRRAVSSGSGRRHSRSTPAASTKATALNANGPASAGSPKPRVVWSARAAKFGAATAPMVVAQTIRDSCRARRFGSARSTAA